MKGLYQTVISIWVILIVAGFCLTLTNLIVMESIYWLRVGILLLAVGIPTIFALMDGYDNKFK
jgi:hypothetical protein